MQLSYSTTKMPGMMFMRVKMMMVIITMMKEMMTMAIIPFAFIRSCRESFAMVLTIRSTMAR